MPFAAFLTAPASENMERAFLTLAAALAGRSGDPSAPEVVRAARANGCGDCPVIGFQDFPGRGFGGAVLLPGEAAHRAALIGRREFLAEAGLEVPAVLESAARRWEGEGSRVLFGGWDGWVRGLLRFDDA